MEDFFERIDVNASLNEIAREICSKCNIENYLSSQIVFFYLFFYLKEVKK